MNLILKGFIEYLELSSDPNLNKDNLFYIFNSFKSWNDERGTDIPKNELILYELKSNRFIANP